MVCSCCVPGCGTRGKGIKFYCLPFTDKTRWPWWLKSCPFLKKYRVTQLDNIRLCYKHFLPEHFMPNGKLTRDAIPIQKITINNPTKPGLYLEIAPINSNTEPILYSIPDNPIATLNINDNNRQDVAGSKENCKDHDYCKVDSDSVPDDTPKTSDKENQGSVPDVTPKNSDKENQGSVPDVTPKNSDKENQEDVRKDVENLDNIPECNDDIPESNDDHAPEFDAASVAEESVVPEAKCFSWEKTQEAVPIPPDPIDDNEGNDNNLSLYGDDKENSPPRDIVEGNDPRLHKGFHCNVCDGEIVGFRYTCVQCSDFDLCSACELSRAHAQHYVLRVSRPRPYAEVQMVLRRIRRNLMQKLDPIAVPDQDMDDAISVKSEIKSEDEDDDVKKELPADVPSSSEPADQHGSTTSDSEDEVVETEIITGADDSVVEVEDSDVQNKEAETIQVPVCEAISEPAPKPKPDKRRILIKFEDFIKMPQTKKICLTQFPNRQLYAMRNVRNNENKSQQEQTKPLDVPPDPLEGLEVGQNVKKIFLARISNPQQYTIRNVRNNENKSPQEQTKPLDIPPDPLRGFEVVQNKLTQMPCRVYTRKSTNIDNR